MSVHVNAHECGQEVVVAGLSLVAGKNGNYAVAEKAAGHSTSFGFWNTAQPETTSHHYAFHPCIPAVSVSVFIHSLKMCKSTLPSYRFSS